MIPCNKCRFKCLKLIPKSMHLIRPGHSVCFPGFVWQSYQWFRFANTMSIIDSITWLSFMINSKRKFEEISCLSLTREGPPTDCPKWDLLFRLNLSYIGPHAVDCIISFSFKDIMDPLLRFSIGTFSMVPWMVIMINFDTQIGHFDQNRCFSFFKFFCFSRFWIFCIKSDWPSWSHASKV